MADEKNSNSVNEPGTTVEHLNAEKRDQLIDVHLGYELSDIEASEITRSSLTKVIVVAGPGASGKTTLLASLNDRFQQSALQDYEFAGSRTLLAFESRSYDVRIASGRLEPEMEKTKVDLDNLRFLHLRVRKKGDGSVLRDLLFSDISGENFRQAKNSSEDCKKLWILKRADRLVLLFDGASLAISAKRQESKSFGIDFLRSCIDSGMIGIATMVDVVISKMDEINQSVNKAETEKFIEEIVKEIRNRFASGVSKLAFFEVAVLPKKDPNLAEGWGLSNIFPPWVEESRYTEGGPREAFHPDIEAREFSRFGSGETVGVISSEGIR